MTDKDRVTIRVNGVDRELLVSPHRTLLDVLREDVGLSGTKRPCSMGECGACAVLIDGTPQLACLLPATVCEGKEVTTVEGLDGEKAKILREEFARAGATQCGFCTPGFAVVTYHLMERSEPVDLVEELSGNLCRCTGYTKILEACRRALRAAGIPVIEREET